MNHLVSIPTHNSPTKAHPYSLSYTHKCTQPQAPRLRPLGVQLERSLDDKEVRLEQPTNTDGHCLLHGVDSYGLCFTVTPSILFLLPSFLPSLPGILPYSFPPWNSPLFFTSFFPSLPGILPYFFPLLCRPRISST